MPEVTFVIGAVATGKSYFVEQMLQREPEMECLDVYDYQQRVYEKEGYGRVVPMGEQRRCLEKANALLLDDILENMGTGYDVIVENIKKRGLEAQLQRIMGEQEDEDRRRRIEETVKTRIKTVKEQKEGST